MKLQLINTKILDLTFKKLEKKDIKRKKKFSLNVGNVFYNDNPKSFAVIFKVNLENPEFDLIINASYRFEAENEITEVFKKSDFPNVNAPAIAFPFLRAYISNFTLQSGFEPSILPSLNFVEIAKSKLVKKK